MVGVAAALALVAIGTGCSGCLWLAVPGLAYQGYKYESGNQNGQTRQHQSAQSPSADDLE